MSALFLMPGTAIIFSGVPDAKAASPLTVTTTADTSSCRNGSLSLHCALNQANADGSGDTITFHIPSTDNKGAFTFHGFPTDN